MTRNFVLLVVYQVSLRIGWIFKTESVIMPAVLDYLGGGGMLRGWLPLVNRLFQSLPSLLAAPYFKLVPLKKTWLFAITLLMCACFGVLALCFSRFAEDRKILQFIFLGVYALFFLATGMNQVLFGTLQAKLIPARQRGKLLLFANMFGVVGAVGAVWLLMPNWVTPSSAKFPWLFLTSCVAFFVSAWVSLLLSEDPDEICIRKVSGLRRQLKEAVVPIRKDANFRKLLIVAGLFGTSIILFPHYQSLGRSASLDGDFRSLLLWLSVQNIGTALFSMLIGPMADRKGNLVALRLALAGVVFAPILAVTLAHFHVSWAYPIVFVLVGLTPVVIRVFMNYTLEAATPDRHPVCLAMVSVATGIPVLFSPIAGWLVDLVGHEFVFASVALIGIAGWWMSGRLREPRADG